MYIKNSCCGLFEVLRDIFLNTLRDITTAFFTLKGTTINPVLFISESPLGLSPLIHTRQYCIAHLYCGRFSRQERAQMSASMYTAKEISLKLSSIANVFVIA